VGNFVWDKVPCSVGAGGAASGGGQQTQLALLLVDVLLHQGPSGGVIAPR
jgi:hypothetical protein